MTESRIVFLSCSPENPGAVAVLRRHLARAGFTVFMNGQGLGAGNRWLEHVQDMMSRCSGFIVLVGQDGVQGRMGGEARVALARDFDPTDDGKRLPIFPIMLADTRPDALPAILGRFQTIRWNGTDALPELLVQRIRQRANIDDEQVSFDGCPFVGLAAYQPNQAHLFFGRQKETLDALACFGTRNDRNLVRWLEIHGAAGSGKSSLMNAGVIPLIEQGWLWAHTGIEKWRILGPMTPGGRPVERLAECLPLGFDERIGEIVERLKSDGNHLRSWVRDRTREGEAFLLAIDQFEELFTLADPQDRRQLDDLLAGALDDDDCRLFVVSTLRADFEDRFHALPRLVRARDRQGEALRPTTVGEDGLRKTVARLARLGGLDTNDVTDRIVQASKGQDDALPLIQTALCWLWQTREHDSPSRRELLFRSDLTAVLRVCRNLQQSAKNWGQRAGLSRLFGLAGWRELYEFRGLAMPGTTEGKYLLLSRARAAIDAVLLLPVLCVAIAIGEGFVYADARNLPTSVALERALYRVPFWIAQPELVPIKEGSVEVPEAGGKEARKIEVSKPFQIGKTEVTFLEWDTCVFDGGCRRKDGEGYHPGDAGWGRWQRPVINVSWDDAQAYVEWLSRRKGKEGACRLPTEAEWEYAARAGTTKDFALPKEEKEGRDDIAGKGLANCAGCERAGQERIEQTLPVASFKPNAWDLYDMHGNVWEWVEDRLSDSAPGARVDPTRQREGGGSDAPRVLRGGSWYGYLDYARSADRFGRYPSYRDLSFGFRVVCSSPSSDH